MTSAIAPQLRDSDRAHILCIGDEVEQLLEMQYHLDSDIDFVIVGCSDEADAALAVEGPFDVIISDQRPWGWQGQLFLSRLRRHSPDAERLMLARRMDRDAMRAAADARVMRLLLKPCPAPVLRDAVDDALLRHRARQLRASAVPRVTPMGGHPCCAYRSA